MLATDIISSPWQQILLALGTIIATLLSYGTLKLKELLSETKSNGGSSIRDQLNRIEESVENINAWVEAGQHLTNKSILRADKEGKLVWVNTAFSRMVGAGVEELKGFGWLNYIAPEDQERVSEEWNDCVKDQRKFESSFSIKSSYTDELKKVKGRAYPISNKSNLLGYLGTWILIEEITD
jgi:PAS domain S-box-containing protein